ncbi:hypothetical protein [Runella slithyformis]|uniref:Uncharacterized protein n=1 Tax=Runella slithyformis (strain ATCC 29530 / DSM 19594 / LMG 11500 / NCIMB 11436 / LSU 4) TaxID=761193 RepID=A0A7U3ZMG5_RUNSL|nr:hypothetical protein [Runella slithyformis]AEI49936.1 hypothetical protein Runsl_3575 [Runella slithyformis DSM 19594]
MKVLATCFLAIVVLAQSLLPRAAMDLLHSPEVWAHFEEHRQEAPQPLSFWEFMMMHYSADSDHTKQKKHHLPSVDANAVTGLYLLPSAIIALEQHSLRYFYKKADFQWLNSYAFLSFKALIYPPRS